MERPGARVGELSVGLQDLEKSIALDGDIERVRRAGEVSLREVDLIGGWTRAQSDLQARRDHRLRAGRRSRLQHGLIEQVLKLNLAALETGGIGVGQIVRNIINRQLLRFHSA